MDFPRLGATDRCALSKRGIALVKKKKEDKKTTKSKAQSAKARLKTNKRIIRFCLVFLGLLVVLTVTFPFISERFNPQLTWMMVATADITGFFLKMGGMEAEVSGRIVSLPNFSIEVVGECTGLYEMLIFLAAVIAYPAKSTSKLMGVGLGIPFLYVINIIRMVFITIVGNWSPNTFDFLHLYLWQVAMILIIVMVWILWIEKVVHRERKAVVIRS
jgi:archaeosortase B (VPXXXP-CTERM-specific)